jgi:hypothetical protein
VLNYNTNIENVKSFFVAELRFGVIFFMYDLEKYNSSKSLDLIPCQCDNCNLEFKRIKKELKHSLEVRKQTNLFCSNKCIGEFYRKRKECVFCKQCNKEILIYPNTFCSQSCAASFNNSKRIRTKKEKVKKEKIYKPRNKKEKLLSCKICSKEFKSKQAKCCSVSCRKIALSQAGLKSVTIQKDSRRSKNEILFANLCFNYFKDVKTNEPIFNGWDADIILPNEKIAILWNGKWHYEKITEKHSVEQVQNRDKIKIREICSLGFKPYIVKDMGKFNKTFVLSEFEKLKSFVSSL